MDELEDEYPIGFYLGNKYSYIGVYRKGRVEIIPNRDGYKATPSIVTIINKDEILRGEDALEYSVKYYHSTIYVIK